MTNTDVIASVAIVALLIMVPLGLTGQNALKSINHANAAQSQVADWLGEDSGLRLLRVKVKGHVVDVQVSGGGTMPDIDSLEKLLSKRLGVAVEARVELFPSLILTSDSQDGAPGNEPPSSARGVDKDVGGPE